MLTENTVSCQPEMLAIILDLEVLRVRTRRCVPLLVDMDIHYQMLKMIYGQGLSQFRMREKMLTFPFLYGALPDRI